MTVKACVIGWPIEHSRSPLVHGHWLAKYGIDGSYTREAVSPGSLAEFVNAMPGSGFAGCNVTVPHKEAVLALADTADDTATVIGAANTLWFEGGRLHATNTDTYGFMTHLEEAAPGWADGLQAAAVLGAGGAARAVLKGLVDAGVPEIRLLNRTPARARALAERFGKPVTTGEWDTRSEALEGCGLLVNTTTLGMAAAPPLDLDLGALRARAVVADIVYAPLATGLLVDARARGHRTVDGLGMLLHQAVPGFEKWFGVRPEVTDDLRSIVVADLEQA